MLDSRTVGLEPLVSTPTNSVSRSRPKIVVRASIVTGITPALADPTRNGRTERSVAVAAAFWRSETNRDSLTRRFAAPSSSEYMRA